jgi:hypothetical protein
MGIQRIMAGLCAVAGAYILAGPGWALLGAAVLLSISPATLTPRVNAQGARVVAATLRSWRWLANGRRRAAAVAMPVALGSMTGGALVLGGIGVGLLVAGVLSGALSLMLGWNQ